MKKCSVFVRGQVWYWNDPVYGDKSDNIDVDRGECTLRYSRYVIIAQTTNSINRGRGILVIPCSTKSIDSTDVELCLAHPSAYSKSYAKVNMIFPISPTFLDRYICTLPDEAISEIDRQITKLLLHNDDINTDDEEENTEVEEEETNDEDQVENIDDIDIDDVPIDEVKEICLTEEDENVLSDKPYDGVSILYNTIKPSVSKFSHMIIKYLRSEGLYNTIDHKHAKSNSKLNSFYGELDEAIFRSIIHFMGIKSEGKEIIYPNVNPDDPHINTWLFFTRIYNDRRISHERHDPILLMSEYKRIYGDEVIDADWRENLKYYILTKMRINQDKADYIVQIIAQKFCV